MRKIVRGAAMGAVLLLVSGCSTSSQYPEILQTTMAQALPPYHVVDTGSGPAN